MFQMSFKDNEYIYMIGTTSNLKFKLFIKLEKTVPSKK